MEDKEFIKDKIWPKILKGEFIRGNNSIIIEFPFVLNDGGRNVEIPKEEFIGTYWNAIKEEINQTIIDYKDDVNIHQEDIVLFALTGEIMIPKLVELGILTER